jgi:SAM-dependent methyltransferase
VLPPASFDFVNTIGCLHHTGNLEAALDNVARLLRPDGAAVVMVYNALSYHRWREATAATARYAFRPNRAPLPLEATTFDVNSSGQGAPETVLVSKGHLRKLMQDRFERVIVEKRNAVGLWPLHRVPREQLLKTLGRVAGLDLYARGYRPSRDASVR